MQGSALILRAPHRAAATVAALREAGIESSCIQLIQAAWPEELSAVDRAVQRWLAAGHDWVVFTSVNTVKVIAARLGGHRAPAGTRVAAVGAATAAEVGRLLHRQADFVPRIQSAAGMLEEWSLPAGTRVFYPHGDLAAPTLAVGLSAWGVDLQEVIAYRTVNADSGAAPVDQTPAPAGISVLPPDQLAARLPATDLLVFSAPSIVRRFVQLAGNTLPARTRTIAIGEPTARALTAAGLPVHAIAADPGPAALTASAQDLLKTITQNR